MLHSIIFSTLGQLATGILLFISLVPPSRIGKGFARFHLGLSLVLWLLAAGAQFRPEFLILFAFLVVTFLFSAKDALYYPSLAVSFLASLYVLIQFDMTQLGTASALYVHLPAVLVLGACCVSMILGHWYLVVPKLSIRYLKLLTLSLIIALVIRSGLLVEAMISTRDHLASIHFYEIYGIFFLQRVALGLLLTLVLSILTYLCVRIRSTQSATGILYVVVVFCLVGELIGNYLFVRTGIAF